MTQASTIARDFSQAAQYYKQNALLQRHVTHEAATLLRTKIADTATILDIGCGTGFFAQHALDFAPQWHIIQADLALGMCQVAAQHERPTVCADLQAIPLANASIDGFFSNLSIQWLEHPLHAFHEAFRILKPQGLACIATFGPSTLSELKHCYEHLGKEAPVLQFPSSESLHTQLQEAGFSTIQQHGAIITEHYPSVLALLKHQRNIGAHFKHRQRGLFGKQQLHTLIHTYEREFATDGQIPARFEIFYFLCQKP